MSTSPRMLVSSEPNARDNAERLYLVTRRAFSVTRRNLTPVCRRILRFIALPYCYLFLIDWQECKASRLRVAADLLYIFFVLKYFPDNYGPCRLWAKPRREWAYYYGSTYDPYQRHRLQRTVQPLGYDVLYVDKSVCRDLCRVHSIPVPEQLGLVTPGYPLRKQLQALRQRHPTVRRIIVKPTSGQGGRDILVVDVIDDGLIAFHKGRPIDLDQVALGGSAVVQEYVKQHPDLAKFSKAVNTVRIVTMKTKDGNVLIVGAYIRFGVGGAQVDNLSQGGISVAVDKRTGRLASRGQDRRSREYERHPTSEIQFGHHTVPCWSEVVRLATNVQQRLAYYKLLGMDIAVTPDGPLVIEINSDYDNVDLEQACTPILKDREVLTAFAEYDLLINRKQRNLLKAPVL